MVSAGLTSLPPNLSAADLIRVATLCNIDETEVYAAYDFNLESALDTANSVSANSDSSLIGKRPNPQTLDNSSIFDLSDDEDDDVSISQKKSKKSCPFPKDSPEYAAFRSARIKEGQARKTRDNEQLIISSFLQSFGLSSVEELKALKSSNAPESAVAKAVTDQSKTLKKFAQQISTLTAQVKKLQGQIEHKDRQILALQKQNLAISGAASVSSNNSDSTSSSEADSLLSDDTPLNARNIKAFITLALKEQVVPLFKDLVRQVKTPQPVPKNTRKNQTSNKSAASPVIPASPSQIQNQPQVSSPLPATRSLISYSDILTSSEIPSNNSVSANLTEDDFIQVTRRPRKRTLINSSLPITPTLVSSSPQIPVAKPPPPPPAHTVLVIPESEGANVVDILKSQKSVKPSELGIKNIVRFASGPSLFTCSSAEQSEKLKTLVASTSGITVKITTQRDPEFKIHNIPIDLSLEEVQNDIRFKFGKPANQILFVTYTKPVVPGTKLAVCKVDYDMFEKASSLRRIRIGWDSCPITTIPHVSRCTKCFLLGHRSKHCTNDFSVEEKMTENFCVDCKSYNDRLVKAKIAKSRHRPTNHTSGVTECPSYQCFLRKASNFSQSSQPSAGGADAMIH